MNTATAAHHYETCRCDVCNEPYQFLRSQLGQTIECPHCKCETQCRQRALNWEKPVEFVPWYRKRTYVYSIVASVCLLLVAGVAGLAGAAALAMGLAIIGGAGFFYFLPSIIAESRGHRNAGGIFLVNLFFGLTLIGWVGALIWATYNDKEPRRA